MLRAASAVNINVNEDVLYDEIVSVNNCLDAVRKSEICTEKMWVLVLRTVDLSEVRKIVCKVLSIPVSNAFVERIFSLMEMSWRAERNRMRIELVKAELAIRINFNMDCQSFLAYLNKPEQKRMIEASKSDKKYNFKP